MPDNPSPTASSRRIVEQLAVVPHVHELGPIAARFVYALRLIAVHDRARRDPVAELATRLGRIEIAAKALSLSQTIAATWPEDIHVSRFCCSALTHDEATIGAMVDAASERDRAAFDAAIAGLVRPSRIPVLWDAAVDLVVSEMHSI